MARYFYTVFLIVALAGAAYLLFYKAPPSSFSPELRGIEGWSTKQFESTVEFGGVSLRLEYATTTEAREFGLGGRESIAENEAMLFVFPEDDYYGFWMNDMLIPVDIFWLDSQGQVVSIEENVAPSTCPDVFYPTNPARYVLETVAGFAEARSITIGTPLLLKNFPSVTE